MPQLSYAYTQPVAFEGMGADTTPKVDLSFFSAESGTTEIGFGRMVKQGSGDFTCNLLSGASDKLVGVTLHSHAYEPTVQLGSGGGILPKEPVTVRKQGRIWVFTEQAVTPADPVHVRYATGAGGTVLGRFRKAAVASETFQLYGANWITSASAGGLAMLEFDILAHNAAVNALAAGSALFAPHA